MDTLTLARYEAQGNDFLIALLAERELHELDASLNARGLARSDVARAVCDRHVGLGTEKGYVHSRGADGFIVGVRNASEGGPADGVRMHLINADGSYAETSGNGLACLAMASFDARIVGAGPLLPFETDAGEQRCSVRPAESANLAGPATPIPADDIAERRHVDVAMNRVGHGPEIPQELDERIRSTFGGRLHNFETGDVGNPHLVIALTEPPIGGEASELNERAVELGECIARLGRAYETYFPNGINVEFIWPFRRNPLQPEQAWTLQMAVWERGAGLTVSCGSGSVVAATLAYRWGFVRTMSGPQVDMRTAPFPGVNGSGFRYRVHVVQESNEEFLRPQLGVVAERVETDIELRLDRVPALLDDLAAMTELKR